MPPTCPPGTHLVSSTDGTAVSCQPDAGRCAQFLFGGAVILGQQLPNGSFRYVDIISYAPPGHQQAASSKLPTFGQLLDARSSFLGWSPCYPVRGKPSCSPGQMMNDRGGCAPVAVAAVASSTMTNQSPFVPLRPVNVVGTANDCAKNPTGLGCGGGMIPSAGEEEDPTSASKSSVAGPGGCPPGMHKNPNFQPGVPYCVPDRKRQGSMPSRAGSRMVNAPLTLAGPLGGWSAAYPQARVAPGYKITVGGTTYGAGTLLPRPYWAPRQVPGAVGIFAALSLVPMTIIASAPYYAMPGTDLTKYLVPGGAATTRTPPLTAMLMGASLGNPGSYTTVKGETLQSVAQKHKISLDALRRANPTVRIAPTMRMSGGFRLSLPR